MKISGVLATFNEEGNVVDCIDSLKKMVDEVIVVDGNSKDRTAELAQKSGAKVIKTTNKTMFHINKNMAIDAASGDWIFLIDADERISSKLAEEVKKIINANPIENGFWVNRKNWFLGGFLNKGGAYPDSVIRLFRKGKGRLPEVSVHEQVDVKGTLGNLKNDLIHLADPSFSRYLMRANRYTSQTAKNFENLKTGKGLNKFLYYTSVKPLLTFLNIYIRHRGYLDGFRGFIWALFSGAHYFFAYIKYYYRKENIEA